MLAAEVLVQGSAHERDEVLRVPGWPQHGGSACTRQALWDLLTNATLQHSRRLQGQRGASARKPGLVPGV